MNTNVAMAIDAVDRTLEANTEEYLTAEVSGDTVNARQHLEIAREHLAKAQDIFAQADEAKAALDA